MSFLHDPAMMPQSAAAHPPQPAPLNARLCSVDALHPNRFPTMQLQQRAERVLYVVCSGSNLACLTAAACCCYPLLLPAAAGGGA
jgi:hypothetical protein